MTCRGEKLMLRTATVRGWQPHAGVLSRACLATLLRILMTGMLASGEKKKGFYEPANWESTTKATNKASKQTNKSYSRVA